MKKFTLVELLIVIAISGLILTGVSFLYSTANSMWYASINRSERAEEIKFSFFIMKEVLNYEKPHNYGWIAVNKFPFRDWYDAGTLSNDGIKDGLITASKKNTLEQKIWTVDRQQGNLFYPNGTSDYYKQYLNLSGTNFAAWWTAGAIQYGDMFNRTWWNKWQDDFPGFNWNNVGIVSDSGFYFTTLGDDNSFARYKSFGIFFDETEQTLYYTESIPGSRLNTYHKIASKIENFSLTYYDTGYNEVQMSEITDSDWIFYVPDSIRYVKIDMYGEGTIINQNQRIKNIIELIH